MIRTTLNGRTAHTVKDASREREAYADEQYDKHIKALSLAVEQEETLRWRLVCAQAAVDVWRSMEASNRNIDRSAS